MSKVQYLPLPNLTKLLSGYHHIQGFLALQHPKYGKELVLCDRPKATYQINTNRALVQP